MLQYPGSPGCKEWLVAERCHTDLHAVRIEHIRDGHINPERGKYQQQRPKSEFCTNLHVTGFSAGVVTESREVLLPRHRIHSYAPVNHLLITASSVRCISY